MYNPSITSHLTCRVCGESARGKHFGAVVCRACAAFFRRSVSSPLAKSCKNEYRCNSFKKGYFTCKYCRLQKCFRVGMSSENFQFDRDLYFSHQKADLLKGKVPQSMDVFCGKSNLIIFCAPGSSSSPDPTRNFIDLQFLLDSALKIFQKGPASPVHSKNQLSKLSVSLPFVRESQLPYQSENMTYGQKEALDLLQFNILKLTKWLTYFDEFQKLSDTLKLKMLQGTWSIWTRLEGLANTATSIKRKLHEETIKQMKNDTLIFKRDSMKLDMSWCSKYALEELKFFLPIPTETRLDELTRAMIELEPSDVELSFMLGQLCFHYVGKKFQGEILQVAERFQEMLANDLHDYYVNDQKKPHYVSRLASMMKINNQIQKEMYKHRERVDVAMVFDVFCVDVSHPDMFLV
ncbi:hypothetical protein CRE_08689 [Caenorhabditis remanei]|uniref:Nuclear Hormone Receptor family n=1 Tax=Caenorhabditis remanei TaxID=31234 RepID=E3LJD8_CAERE|nr:hypothetical protein CRE_08689 [Caenorhabditis remanei]